MGPEPSNLFRLSSSWESLVLPLPLAELQGRGHGVSSHSGNRRRETPFGLLHGSLSLAILALLDGSLPPPPDSFAVCTPSVTASCPQISASHTLKSICLNSPFQSGPPASVTIRDSTQRSHVCRQALNLCDLLLRTAKPTIWGILN